MMGSFCEMESAASSNSMFSHRSAGETRGREEPSLTGLSIPAPCGERVVRREYRAAV
jgi:hypothetical protein